RARRPRRRARRRLRLRLRPHDPRVGGALRRAPRRGGTAGRPGADPDLAPLPARRAHRLRDGLRVDLPGALSPPGGLGVALAQGLLRPDGPRGETWNQTQVSTAWPQPHASESVSSSARPKPPSPFPSAIVPGRATGAKPSPSSQTL